MKPLSPIQRLSLSGWALATALSLLGPGLAFASPAVDSICARIYSSTGKPEENRDKLFRHWRQELDKHSKEHQRRKNEVPMDLAHKAHTTHQATLEHKFTDICAASDLASKSLASLAARLDQKERGLDAQACQSFSGDVETFYKASETAMSTLETGIRKHADNAKEEFRSQALQNLSAINAWDRSQRQKVSNLATVDQQVAPLRNEFNKLWGEGLSEAALGSATNFSISDTSYFGQIHKMFDNEVAAAAKAKEAFAAQSEKRADLEKRCSSLLGFDTGLSPHLRASPPELEKRDTHKGPDEKVVNNPEQPAPRIPDQPPVQATTTPPPEKSFLSENKEVLIVGGVGVAAVGGLLYYKKQQDKKEQEADEAFFNAQMAIQANRSTSSSSGETGTGNTSGDSYVGGPPPTNGTPPGSWLSISGIPSGASVNSNLTEISIGIVSPQGVLTQDSDTDITVGCEAPVPCSLTGTTTVNTHKGKAIFNNLRFTGPHTGVKLKFSAPGFETAVSPNSFDVTQ